MRPCSWPPVLWRRPATAPPASPIISASCKHTIGADAEFRDGLEAFRKKRNLGFYERAGQVTDQEAQEMFNLAKRLRDQVTAWLRAKHRKLL